MVLYYCVCLLSILEALNILLISLLYFREDSSSFFCISLSIANILFFFSNKNVYYILFKFLVVALFVYEYPKTLFLFCSYDALNGEDVAKLMKITWWILPRGMTFTLFACMYIFWSEGLSFSHPNAKAYLIIGNLLFWFLVSPNCVIA